MNRVFRVVWNPAQGLWVVASEVARGLGRSSTQAPVVALALLGLAGSAAADCSGPSGGTITCMPGTPQTFVVIGGYDATPGGTVDVQPDAVISTTNLPAISMGDNGTILVQRDATVQNNAAGSANGHYGTGANSIEFRSNTTLTIEEGAKVLSNGTAHNAEAINPHGGGNLIVNHGEVRSQAGGAAIWLEASSGTNTVINGATGVIEYKGGAGNILGVSGTMAVDFLSTGGCIPSACCAAVVPPSVARLPWPMVVERVPVARASWPSAVASAWFAWASAPTAVARSLRGRADAEIGTQAEQHHQ